MNSKWIISLIFIAVIAGAFYAAISGDNDKYVWEHTLEKTEKQPYDLTVFYAGIKHTLKDKYHESGIADSVAAVIHKIKQKDASGVYFYAGPNMYLNENDVSALSNFVSEGGTAFLLVENVPQELLDSFAGLRAFTVSSFLRDSITVNFTKGNFKQNRFNFSWWVRNEKSEGYWHYLSSNKYHHYFNVESGTGWKKYEVPNHYVALSHVQSDFLDFIRVPHGLGNIYLHVNPVLLGNIYLKSPEGREYAANVIQHIPYATLYVHNGAAYPKPNSHSGYTEKSVYGFIKQNKSLWYAWWFLLGGTALFLIMGGRRKQRSIPVILPPKNKTKEWVENIGYFYFRETNHALVYRKEWNQFQNFVRLHFRFVVDNDENNWLRLAEKSGVSEKTVLKVLNTNRDFGSFSELKAEELVQCNQAFSNFYTEYFNKNGK